MARVVHFSDWHGEWQKLPEADVYVCTGDMLPNFPDIRFRGERSCRDVWVSPDPCSAGKLSSSFELDGELFRYSLERRVDHAKEARLQTEWARLNQITPFLGSPQAPIVCVRGNHDFVPLSLLFEGCWVHEFGVGEDESEMFDAAGLCFTGARGIPYIIGEWADELSDSDMRLRMAKVPLSVDVLVTHAPPQGVMDLYGNMHIGCPHISSWIQRQAYAISGPNPNGYPLLRAHLFGHNHRPGVETVSGTVFSNAATAFNVLEL
jgi:Icc-related predicted phosphoesterase